jgi:hypothetical protein
MNGNKEKKSGSLHSWDCQEMSDTTFLTSNRAELTLLRARLDWKDTGHGLIKI